jgi:hypothetical protein
MIMHKLNLIKNLVLRSISNHTIHLLSTLMFHFDKPINLYAAAAPPPLSISTGTTDDIRRGSLGCASICAAIACRYSWWNCCWYCSCSDNAGVGTRARGGRPVNALGWQRSAGNASSLYVESSREATAPMIAYNFQCDLLRRRGILLNQLPADACCSRSNNVNGKFDFGYLRD